MSTVPGISLALGRRLPAATFRCSGTAIPRRFATPITAFWKSATTATPKTVDLDSGQLRGGRLAFHNSSDTVSFHLTVYINSRLSVSETLNWHP